MNKSKNIIVETEAKPDAHNEFRKAMSDLGFIMVVPHIKRKENFGTFWLFGEEVKKYEKLITKKMKLKIKTDNFVFDIQASIATDYIRIGKGKKEWGAPDYDVFIIKLK